MTTLNGGAVWEGRGVYSIVACLSRMAVDHASLARRGERTQLLLALVV